MRAADHSFRLNFFNINHWYPFLKWTKDEKKWYYENKAIKAAQVREY